MKTGNSHSTNIVLSSYPLNFAIQSCPIIFRQLIAFLPCYVPVSAFAFRLGRQFTALSYGVEPFFYFSTDPIWAHQLLTLLGAMHVYLGLTLLGVALGALGRDRPSALVVLAGCHIANLLFEIDWCLCGAIQL